MKFVIFGQNSNFCVKKVRYCKIFTTKCAIFVFVFRLLNIILVHKSQFNGKRLKVPQINRV